DVEIIGCEIVREKDGLAMSSRNMRLSADQRKQAVFLHQLLENAKTKSQTKSPIELKSWVEFQIESKPHFKLDYFEIAEEQTLKPILKWNKSIKSRLFIAAFLGEIRLIDNLPLNN